MVNALTIATLRHNGMLILGYSFLCSEFAVKQIDEPFTLPSDDEAEWAL